MHFLKDASLLSKGVVRVDNSFKIGDGLSIVFNKKIVAKGIAKIDSTTVGESSVLIHKRRFNYSINNFTNRNS